MRTRPSHREPYQVNFYSIFAFASVILSCFSQFVFARRLYGETWQVLVTFLLGGIYAIFAVTSHRFVYRFGQQWRLPLYLLNTVVVTVMVYVSPARGFFGIIALPMISQAIMEFRPLWAGLFSLYYFAASVGVFAFYYGAAAGLEGAISYVAAFAFTIVFTAITKKALDARELSEHFRRELEEANHQLREHARQAEELATTRERNRLAREIHDGVGHYLTVVKTQLDAAAALMPTQPDKARDAVEKAAKLSAEALDDVRRSVGTLRTDAARPPLADSLRQLAAHAEPAMLFEVLGTPRELSAAAEHTLFRAAQEALTNIRKHAHATTASLTLDFREPVRVRLAVTDDGRGPQPALTTCGLTETGYGLRGLRERTEILGGRFAAGARPGGGGFEVTVEVPA
ncbi:MAG: sensor histidine kinase [Opitutae bacterium]|nr:sensor histidine kinase [Opitutae bacterium]